MKLTEKARPDKTLYRALSKKPSQKKEDERVNKERNLSQDNRRKVLKKIHSSEVSRKGGGIIRIGTGH